jgi:hypothetical protein
VKRFLNKGRRDMDAMEVHHGYENAVFTILF